MINSYCFKGTNSKAPRLQQFSDIQFPIPRTFLEEPSHGCVHIDQNTPRETSIKFLVFIGRFKVVV